MFQERVRVVILAFIHLYSGKTDQCTTGCFEAQHVHISGLFISYSIK
jgi:hypothetical protein